MIDSFLAKTKSTGLWIAVSLLCCACEEQQYAEPCNDNVCVTDYDGQNLTAEDSWKTEWEGGPVRKWVATVSNDTIRIERTGFCGDECGETYQLVLEDRGTALPKFVSCSYTAHHIFPEELIVKNILTEGTVAIDNWSLTGILSGKVSGRWTEWDSFSFVFWVDLTS